MNALQIYLLLAPVLVVVFALIMVVLTRWDEKRYARRRAKN